MAYARAARACGVTFRPRTAVTGITLQGQRVVGVDVGGEPISGGTVIDAAGAWAALVSQLAGYTLPMAPVRSHYWICEANAAFGADHPITVLSDAAAYTRPETGGLVLGIQEARSKTFDARDLPSDMAAFSPTAGEEHWDILADAADAVEAFFPAVLTARFSNYVAGLSAYTPDGAILLGPVPGLSGFLAAAGCCGSGVALSGGIGAIVSDLVLGNPTTCDITPFDPGRFGRIDPYGVEFRDRCATARAAKTRRLN
jgi:4-methylaminobutanoate oxidase (formaldehyde-forming)